MTQSESGYNRFALRPTLSMEMVKQLAGDVFGLNVDSADPIEELCAYLDRNYCISGKLSFPEEAVVRSATAKAVTKDPRDENISKRYVLKVINANETFFRGESTLDGTDECIMYLHGAIGKHVDIPMPQKTTNGTYKKLVCVPTKRSCLADEFINAAEELAIEEGLLDRESASEDKKKNIVQVPHYIRLLTYIEGVVLGRTIPTNELLLHEAGKLAAKVSSALQHFTCTALERKWSVFDIKYLDVLGTEKYLNAVPGMQLRRSIGSFLQKFNNAITPFKSSLPTQMIHSDISENNIIIPSEDNGSRISGLIDFGDLIHSYRLSEIANCMAHNGTRRGNPIEDCGIVLSGYLSECELTESEFGCLYYFVIGRLLQCAVLGFHTMTRQGFSQNNYVLDLTERSVKSFKLFLDHLHDEKQIVDSWRKIGQ